MFKLFERFTNPYPETKELQPPNSLLAFCLYYSRGFKVPLALLSLATATIAILEALLFSFMGDLVDWISIYKPDQLFAEKGDSLWLMAAILLIVFPALSLFHSLIMHQTLLGNYPMSIRWLAHRYLLKQSLSFYQNDFAGRIATKVMQTSLAVRETVMKLLDVMVYVAVYFISMLVLVAQSDWRLMLPLLIWLVAYIGIQLFFVPKFKKIATEQADGRSVMTGRIVDSYTNISTVKLFAHTDRESDYARESMNIFLDTVYRQMRMGTGFDTSVNTINYLLTLSTAAVSIYLWSESAVTVGAIAIAVSLSLRLAGISHWIMWEISALFENIGTVVDGMRTLSKPIGITDSDDAKDIEVPAGAIHFDRVSFAYDANNPVFKSLNLQIKPGEKVGIVGRSGAGKSTLVNLLLRFYELQQGKVSIDDCDISKVTQDSLRAQIGMVTQDTSLLHRSIRENILYGRPDATEAELLAALKQAQADSFIEQLTDPDGNRGLDAQVGERGVKLSGGQRQRIAIARVLLKDAPILVLDEATSALDSEVEAAIQQSLYQLMEGKTVIAIAHRLSTIAAMDRLIVIDQGEIVEEGSHKELLASGGIYAQLWAHQTGGFLGLE
ncbi:ABC transporter ATP-binding protein [Marinobacterium sp. LSUCC0821]|uniref:ABC transporter ATP-binding protein n=1 Tax=Marinobacterium sp. LSUCC0821 TaxID=2668067 RepID=UPI0014519E84|nr:ABC transporter ATP-binding protein [Marinobacterium sp. LSUCC0821]QJD70790.1 ABC transporter ATP-binding protein [Marinobacterium sp. LSUCC0821]